MADQRKRDIRPPELAALVDFAERPRVADWSLRAALTRYAQPQPQRVGDLLDLVRRTEFALGPQMDVVEGEGPELWDALQAGDGPTSGPEGFVVGLLRALAEIDRLGDALAAWAVDGKGERPDAAVDSVIASVARQLAELGVPEQERPGPPRAGGRRSRG